MQQVFNCNLLQRLWARVQYYYYTFLASHPASATMLLCFSKLVPFTGLILQCNIEQCVRNKILMQTPIPYFCRGFGSEDDILSPHILQIK